MNSLKNNKILAADMYSNLSLSGKTITGTKLDNTSTVLNIPLASATSDGFMSSADKTKLNNLQNYNANIKINYYIDDQLKSGAVIDNRTINTIASWLGTSQGHGQYQETRYLACTELAFSGTARTVSITGQISTYRPYGDGEADIGIALISYPVVTGTSFGGTSDYGNGTNSDSVISGGLTSTITAPNQKVRINSNSATQYVNINIQSYTIPKDQEYTYLIVIHYCSGWGSRGGGTGNTSMQVYASTLNIIQKVI